MRMVTLMGFSIIQHKNPAHDAPLSLGSLALLEFLEHTAGQSAQLQGIVELMSGEEGIFIVVLGAEVLRALPSLALFMQGCGFTHQFS